jgi:hypothetical protein
MHVQKNKITRRKSESENVNIESTWFAFFHMELILNRAVLEKGEDSKQSIHLTPRLPDHTFTNAPNVYFLISPNSSFCFRPTALQHPTNTIGLKE